MAEWYGVADEEAQQRVLGAWKDAPLDNLEVCSMILATAREQVLACAPEPPEDSLAVIDGVLTNTFVIPESYVYAQRLVAMKTWQSEQANAGGDVSAEGFTFTPYQRDRLIREIIRPKDGKPHVL